ncbi:3-ketosteroid 1-dehydrogenase helE [Colletotrichum spaethianum]|uniref:3-ketosteroid 1-dehydrogenase helE n=1 Tax=Colletotrichum spaethianum TaxID=700344 RepID=A0AA37UPS3_9PEZI|nr:3-ketosteroid 1-dehydrogenase helE [Colletotrichum spaethianum]GKT47567.1 3-ketosteroid 1-dehydrogenase helE [Colletotrichum spaethianum]
MDDAWWGPTIIDPVTRKPYLALVERARPHYIIVDAKGKRFNNKAAPYTDAVQVHYEQNKFVELIPTWLVMDASHRNRYLLGTQLFARIQASWGGRT